MDEHSKHLETKLILAGEIKPLIMGAVSMPVFSIVHLRVFRANQLS